MIPEVRRELLKRGLQARIVSARHIGELQEEIEGRHSQKLFDEEYYQELRTYLSFEPPEEMPGPSCLIVVSVPQPQFRVVFNWKGKRWPLMIPPTYLYGTETNNHVGALLAEILTPHGYRAVRASLPIKSLAVHSGLAAYGRNNVSYVSSTGSFHRLAGFYSDLPCPNDNWRDLQMMEACQKCSACRRSCPTGAINSDRCLLHAERCITFHNEHSTDVPFPEWINDSWHNCLVGCLHCQRVCPTNKEALEWVEAGPEFTEEETTLLLRGVPLDQLPGATQEKLTEFDMLEYVDVFPRNLRVLLDPRGQGERPL